jgi:hypothetical protein
MLGGGLYLSDFAAENPVPVATVLGRLLFVETDELEALVGAIVESQNELCWVFKLV